MNGSENAIMEEDVKKLFSVMVGEVSLQFTQGISWKYCMAYYELLDDLNNRTCYSLGIKICDS